MNNKFGFIEQIDETKFTCGGNIYIISNLSESNRIANINNMILNMKFDNKIFNIVNQANEQNETKTLSVRNFEIEKFLKEKENSILDIIFFPDNGLRGNDKIVYEENSIFYIKISENIKLGFFVNKMILNAIKGGFEDNYETE